MAVTRSNSYMDPAKKERLEAKGWKVGTVSEFLELTPEETDIIEAELRDRSVEKEGCNNGQASPF